MRIFHQDLRDEWGIFNEDGLIEGQFSSRAAAEQIAERDYPEDGRVFKVCPDHADQRRDHCEECNAEPLEPAPKRGRAERGLGQMGAL